MKILTLIARILLGLTFLVFGLNGFLHFIPQQPMPNGPALQFILALAATHYVHVVFAIQTIAGVLFLINRYVPLALTIIAPVIVNILLFHGFMAPAGIGPGLLVTICWLIVFLYHRAAFAGLFTAKA